MTDALGELLASDPGAAFYSDATQPDGRALGGFEGRAGG